MSTLTLKPRAGTRPETSNQLPHSQLTQHGPDEVIEQLHEFCFAFPHIVEEPSQVAPPGTRAMILDTSVEGNDAGFMIGREFAHIHPYPDKGSMHVQLSAEDAEEVISKGWGEDHYLVTQGHFPKGLVLVFSPRNQDDLDAMKAIVTRSYQNAKGIG